MWFHVLWFLSPAAKSSVFTVGATKTMTVSAALLYLYWFHTRPLWTHPPSRPANPPPTWALNEMPLAAHQDNLFPVHHPTKVKWPPLCTAHRPSAERVRTPQVCVYSVCVCVDLPNTWVIQGLISLQFSVASTGWNQVWHCDINLKARARSNVGVIFTLHISVCL